MSQMQTVQRHLKLINVPCDVKGTFDFNISQMSTVGHVEELSFSIGGKALNKDYQVGNPESPAAKIPVVGVIQDIRWSGGPTDPIWIVMSVNAKNKSIIADALASPNGGADIKIKFKVHAWDYDAKKYFVRYSTDDKEVQTVITAGSEVDLGEKPNPLISQPTNFLFGVSLTSKAEAGEQMLVYGTSAESKRTVPFGVPAA